MDLFPTSFLTSLAIGSLPNFYLFVDFSFREVGEIRFFHPSVHSKSSFTEIFFLLIFGYVLLELVFPLWCGVNFPCFMITQSSPSTRPSGPLSHHRKGSSLPRVPFSPTPEPVVVLRFPPRTFESRSRPPKSFVQMIPVFGDPVLFFSFSRPPLGIHPFYSPPGVVPSCLIAKSVL